MPEPLKGDAPAIASAGDPYLAMHEALERQARVLADTISALDVFDKGLTDAMGSLIRTIQNLKPLVPQAPTAGPDEISDAELAGLLDDINDRIDRIATLRAGDLAAAGLVETDGLGAETDLGGGRTAS